jgi:hypothetical protein
VCGTPHGQSFLLTGVARRGIRRPHEIE